MNRSAASELDPFRGRSGASLIDLAAPQGGTGYAARDRFYTIKASRATARLASALAGQAPASFCYTGVTPAAGAGVERLPSVCGPYWDDLISTYKVLECMASGQFVTNFRWLRRLCCRS